MKKRMMVVPVIMAAAAACDSPTAPQVMDEATRYEVEMVQNAEQSVGKSGLASGGVMSDILSSTAAVKSGAHKKKG